MILDDSVVSLMSVLNTFSLCFEVIFQRHVLQLYSFHTDTLSAFTILWSERPGARFTRNSLQAALLNFFDMML